jgi:hypothetical protein
MSVSRVLVFTLPMFDLVVSHKIFRSVYWTTSISGPRSLATVSMRPKNYSQTIEFGLVGRKGLASSQLPTL